MAKAHIAFVKKNHNHRVQLFLGGITILIPSLIKMSAFDWSMIRWYKTHATGW
jgi:hypothetical protein